MNVIKEETGNGNPNGKPQDLALQLDAAIPQMLGFRCEVVDDYVTVWPKDVVPDDTNWLVGDRFTQSLPECMNILDGLKAEVTFHEEAGFHWVELTFPEGSITTSECDTKEMAAAYATYAALFGKQNRAKSRVT
jgi:hypothetical protein